MKKWFGLFIVLALVGCSKEDAFIEDATTRGVNSPLTEAKVEVSITAPEAVKEVNVGFCSYLMTDFFEHKYHQEVEDTNKSFTLTVLLDLNRHYTIEGFVINKDGSEGYMCSVDITPSIDAVKVELKEFKPMNWGESNGWHYDVVPFWNTSDWFDFEGKPITAPSWCH